MSIFVGPYDGAEAYHSPAFGAHAVFGAQKPISEKDLKSGLSSLKDKLASNIKVANTGSAADKKVANANIALLEAAIEKAKNNTPPTQASAPAPKPVVATVVPKQTQGPTRAQGMVTSAEPVNSEKLTGELKEDNKTISNFKDRVEKEKDSAIVIQGKIKFLSAALAASEKSLKDAQDQLAGKSTDHGDAIEKVKEAELKVATCTATILGLETNIGALALSLKSLSDEIDRLNEAQKATLTLFPKDETK